MNAKQAQHFPGNAAYGWSLLSRLRQAILIVVLFFSIFTPVCSEDNPAGFDDLLKQLGSPEAKAKWLALDALKDWAVDKESGEIPREKALEIRRAVPLLIALITDKDYGVRRAAILLLGRIGDPAAVEPLVAVLNKDQAMMDPLTEALGRIGDVRAVEPLLQACKRANTNERGAPEWALEQIRHKEAVICSSRR